MSRAALYDHDDFLCIASSSQAFDLPPDDVRKILDGQLTFSRQGDPTMASGAAHPPDNLSVGKEGKASVKRGNGDWIVAELNGKAGPCLRCPTCADARQPFIAARTATNVLLVEGNEDANVGSLETLVQSFQEGLQQLTSVVPKLAGPR